MKKFVAAGVFASVSALLFPPQAAAQQAGLNDYGATTLGGSAYLTWAFPAARGNAIRTLALFEMRSAAWRTMHIMRLAIHLIFIS